MKSIILFRLQLYWTAIAETLYELMVIFFFREKIEAPLSLIVYNDIKLIKV